MYLFKSELDKILKKRELRLVLVITAAIPLLIGVMINSGSDVVDFNGMSEAPLYSIGLWALLRLLMLTYLVPVIAISSNLGSEIDLGIVGMFITRYPRVQYYCIKQIANFIYITVFYIIYLIFSFLSFYLFVKESDASILTPAIESNIFCYGLFLSYLEILLLTFIVQALCARFGAIGSGLLGICIMILFKIVENIDEVKNLIPTYITDISRVLELQGSQLGKDLFEAISLLCLYSALFFLVGMIYFKKKDI